MGIIDWLADVWCFPLRESALIILAGTTHGRSSYGSSQAIASVATVQLKAIPRGRRMVMANREGTLGLSVLIASRNRERLLDGKRSLSSPNWSTNREER